MVLLTAFYFINMKSGDKFECPHCGEMAFLVKKHEVDGWNVVGTYLACSFCGEKIEEVDGSDCQYHNGSLDKDESKKKLSAMLGVSENDLIKIKFQEETCHFCKDCDYAIVNPFRIICSRTMKEVQPMADCESFTQKKHSLVQL